MALRFLNSGYFAGSVGIGEQSPLAKLQITTPFASSPSDCIFLFTNGSNTPGGGSEITFGSSTSATPVNYNAKIQGIRSALDDGSSDMRFLTTHVATATFPDTKMIIKSDGNVGIGTTDPNQKLSVKGVISSDANDDYYGAWLSGNSNGTADNYIGLGAWYSTAGYLSYVHNNRLKLYTYDDNEHVTLQEAGGFVGIGTSAPRGLLELGTGGTLGAVTNKKISVIIDGGYSTTNALQYNVTSFIGTTLTETSTDIFDQTGSETGKNFYAGLIAPNSYFNNSRYGIVQGGGERLTISQGGFTGIGETTPISRLEVAGSLNLDGQRFVFNSDDVTVTGAGTTNQQPIKWNEETHYIPSLAYAFKVKLTVTGTGTDTGANYIVFYNNTTSAWVARAVNLAGAGSNHALLNVDSDATGTSMYAYHNHPGGYNIRYWVETFDTGDQDVDGHFFGSDFQWQRNTTDLFYNDGDVGIGTTSPNGKLDVTGNIWLNADNANAAYYLRINRGQSQDGGILLYGNGVLDWQLVNLANRDLNWYSYGGGSSVMRLTSAGNLGIGTTSPGEKLDVNGNVKIKDALLSNQENTDIDTGAEVVAQVAHATYTAAFFDFVVKKGTNVRSGTVYACHDGDTTPLVEFTETSTNDLGDTSDVTLSVDISGTNMRLLATVTSDDWSVKSLIRAI